MGVTLYHNYDNIEAYMYTLHLYMYNMLTHVHTSTMPMHSYIRNKHTCMYTHTHTHTHTLTAHLINSGHDSKDGRVCNQCGLDALLGELGSQLLTLV